MKHRRNKILLGCSRRWLPAEQTLIAMLFGGFGYGLIEVIWRGYTHPSMVLTGGICFTAIYFINREMREVPLLLRSSICTFIVIALEFSVGMLVNRILHLDVWDYSEEKFNLFGQICLEYSLLWFLLCTALSIAVTIFFCRDHP